ncbi:MAG: hypothetical protein HYU57_08555 [Micavibrio aeruginosavorus]|nr:hypothetical protein [Micavibrio aeruginosavorus]
MTLKIDFEQRIKALRDDRRNENGYTRRDIHLARFMAAWKPLTDHIQALADRHLPADKRLRIEFGVNETLELNLKFVLETDKAAEDPSYERYPDSRWWGVSTLYFFNSNQGIVADSILGLRRLSDLFKRNNENGRFALNLVDIGEPDPKLKGIVIHPGRVEPACDLLEYWLAKQIAFQFNPAMVNPKSGLEITIKRRDSDPENGPL